MAVNFTAPTTPLQLATVDAKTGTVVSRATSKPDKTTTSMSEYGFTGQNFGQKVADFYGLVERLTLRREHQISAETRRQKVQATFTFETFRAEVMSIFGGDLVIENLKTVHRKLLSDFDAEVDWSELFGCGIDEADLIENSTREQLSEEDTIFMISRRACLGEASMGMRKKRDTVSQVLYLGGSGLDAYLLVTQHGICTIISAKSYEVLHQVQAGPVDGWSTGAVLLPNMRRVCVPTDRQMAIWDYKSTRQAFVLHGLRAGVLCVSAVNAKKSTSTSATTEVEDTILWGDDHGFVNSLRLPQRDLKAKVSKRGDDYKFTESFDLEPKDLTYAITRRQVHNSWCVRIKYIPELNQICTSSDSETQSICLFDLAALGPTLTIHEENKLEQNHGGNVGLRKSAYGSQSQISLSHISYAAIPKGVNAFVYSTRGNVIITGGADKILRIWHPGIWKRPTGRLLGHLFTITDVAFNETDQQIISVSAARIFRVWDLHSLTELQVFTDTEPRAGERRIHTICYDNANLVLLSGSCMLDVWPLVRKIQDQMTVPRSHDSPLVTMAFNPATNQIATACTEPVLRLWDLENGRLIFQKPAPHGHNDTKTPIVCAMTTDAEANSLATIFVAGETDASGGLRLATGGSDGSIIIWDFNSLQELKKYEIPSENSAGETICREKTTNRMFRSRESTMLLATQNVTTTALKFIRAQTTGVRYLLATSGMIGQGHLKIFRDDPFQLTLLYDFCDVDAGWGDPDDGWLGNQIGFKLDEREMTKELSMMTVDEEEGESSGTSGPMSREQSVSLLTIEKRMT